MNAAYSIGFAFLYIFDKKLAWEDLLDLTRDGETIVRRGVIDAILAAFPYILDKNQAWNELYRLTQDMISEVQWHATIALGTAFTYTPDKNQAWNDLYKLTLSKDSYLRAHAYYSLGKVSIFKSTAAENKQNLKRELEIALEFFEKSLKEESAYFFNPAKFCLPFYRSFYMIIFKEREANMEVQKYLSEARKESLGSESKGKLLEAIENLSNALSEAYQTKEKNLEVMKRDLNTYRRYCERAAELLRTTEEKAPGATKLIRKSLPIIDQRIKDIISDTHEKSNALCKQTLNTPFEDLGKEVNRIGKIF